MAYGILKCDNITFDNGGSDQNVTVSGLYRATTSGVTVSGTIAATTVSGVTVIGSTTVSGATVTGTTANFTSGNFSNIISSAATMSGALIMANQQQVRFREAVGNGVNHIALQAPAIVSADQTITLPDQTGTVVTTGDNGSVTSTMILDGTILNVDINASAAIAGTKISPDFGSQTIVTTGVHSAALGSAAAPSIAFTGDLNTGIYSPGADQVAISTNGTGRLFVDASGRVGVGTGSPSSNGLVTIAETTNARLYLADSTVGYNYGAQLRGYGVGGAGGYAELGVVDNDIYSKAITVTEQANAIIFSRGATERMRLDSSGRLGLGTSSPSSRLHVRDAHTLGNASQIVLIENTTAGEPASLAFLAVADNAGAGNQGAIYFDAGADGSTADNKLQFTAAHQSSITPQMTLNGSGQLGIGTSSPGVNLDVASTTPTVRVNATGGGTPSLSLFSSGVYDWLVQGGTALKIVQDTTERARIDSSGRLLVGTSTARGNFFNTTGQEPVFQVEGTTNQTARISVTRCSNDDAASLLIFGKSRSASVGGNTIVSQNDFLGGITFQGADGSEMVPGAFIFAEVDGTPGANDMPGRLVFSTTADGAATPTERLRITSAGVLQIADAGDITVGTTTGTKIGTATTQKIGFYNATPVVQPTAVADATDAASVITQLNALLTRMRNLGLIAT